MTDEPFLGEIQIYPYGQAPRGWAQCNGQLLPINQNQALFALLGINFGGNGQTTFALPDLRGRVPIHLGGGHNLAERAGEESHTLTISELPTHTHLVNASASPGNDVGSSANPLVLASPLNQTYRSPSALTPLAPGTIGNAGGSQPHQNMQPYLTLTFCIALQGIFPSQN